MEEVLAVFQEDPHKSTRTVAREVGTLSATSVWRILRDAKFHPYKMQRHQQLTPQHRVRRVAHAQAQLQRIANEPGFVQRLLFSDEAHFSIHGDVNRHNFRYWANNNPHWVREAPLHSPRLTVWAAIGHQRVIGPFFFEDTVTAASYLALLQERFYPAAQELPNFHELIFMQDGAPPHWALPVRNWLTTAFPERWMGRDSPNLPWPANSPDLTPCDFFLWGYLKDRVYRTQPTDLNELRARIQQEFATLPQAVVNSSIDSYSQRLRRCIDVEGRSVE